METIAVKEKRNAKIVAHRGLSGIERENTLPAFAAACNRDYYGIECDVHVTADKKYVVYHDDDTGRLCDKKVVLEQSDFACVRSLRIKEAGKDDFSGALVIPALEEYLQMLARYGKTAVIELKNAMAKSDIAEIIGICKAVYDLNNIIFISFSYENLVAVRELLPEQKVQYLTCEFDEELIGKLKRYSMDLDIYYTALTEENVKKLHENGIVINCWTCDDPAAAEKLAAWGVDMITSNILQ